MTPEDLRQLAARATLVEDSPEQLRSDVHARIGSMRRRRQSSTVGAAVVAVVVALTAGLALLAVTDTDDTPPAKPAPRPTSTPSVLEEKTTSVRRVTYATAHKIHWGDRVIDVGSNIWDVAATDDGVVFVRERKGRQDDCWRERGAPCRTLWFTDGSDIFPIGNATGSVIRGFDVSFSEAGSTVVWSEPDPNDHTPIYPRRGEYVAYDTDQRREVGRFGSERSQLVAVLDDDVYWLPDARQCVDFYGECLRFKGNAMRFETSTGRQVPVSWASYRAVRSDSARTLVSPQLEEIADGTVVTPAHPQPKFNNGFGFRRDGNRLVGDDGSVDVTVRVARTGRPLRLRIPADYTASDYFDIIQWLDDDRVVLSASDTGDLFVCRLSGGRCRLVVTKSTLTGFKGRG